MVTDGHDHDAQGMALIADGDVHSRGRKGEVEGKATHLTSCQTQTVKTKQRDRTHMVWQTTEGGTID